MKSIKNIFYVCLALSIVLIGSCNDDEGLVLAPDDNVTPGNIVTNISLSNDDTGTLMVSAVGEGVASFEILFGDEADEEPTVVSPGETATNVYEEGDFILTVTAISVTGVRVDFTENIVVRFAAPEDLTTDIQIVGRTVTITPAATNALMFDIFFGDVENEEATTILSGNSAEHTYDEDGEFTIRTIARSASATTIETTDVVNVMRPLEPLVLPIDFESENVTFNFIGFEGATSDVVENPAPGGVNTSDNVGMTNKAAGAQFFAGSFLDLAEPIDFSQSQTITMDVLSPRADIVVMMRLEPAGGGGGDAGVEVPVRTTLADEWETLTYDFSTTNFNVNDFERIIFFFDFENAGDGSDYFFDNVSLQGPSAPLELPVNFEGSQSNISFVGFEGATSNTIANPFPGGINNSSTVAMTNKAAGAQFFAGSFFDLDVPVDFSQTQTITMDVYSPQSDIVVMMRLEPAGGGGGDAGVEVPVRTTVSNEWETLTYDFSTTNFNVNDFERVIFFFDFENPGTGADYFFDNVSLLEPSAPLELPVNFEGSQSSISFVGFEGATSNTIANPFPSGINNSSTVAMTNKAAGSQFFAGSFFDLEVPVDFSETQTITMDVYSPQSDIVVMMRLEPAGGGGGDAGVEVPVRTTVSNEWETLTYDFSTTNFNVNDFVRVVFFFDFENPGTGADYFFDNVQLDGQDSGGSGTNLLINGDFESGSAPWTAGVGTDPAPVVTDGGNSFYSVNVEMAGDVFSVNLTQMLEIVDGSTYVLTFDAWSDRDRNILAGIGLSDGDFSNNSMSVSLSAQRQTFTLTLTADGFGANNARVLFDNGGEVGVVNIDDVSLVLMQ